MTEEGFEIALPSSKISLTSDVEHVHGDDAISDTVTETDRHVSRRRNSCLTEEGFEIALPTSQSVQTKRRRQSVLVEDGHEIVLCRREESLTGLEETSDVSLAGGTTPLTLQSSKRNGTTNSQHQTNGAKTGFISRGGSCIISPSGEVLRGPQWEDDQGILWADVDFEDCVRGRLDFDAAGSYSRNDSFKFHVEGLDMSPLAY